MLRKNISKNISKIDTNDALDLRSRGADYFMLGLYENALQDLNRSLIIEPNNALTLRIKLDVLNEQDDFNKSLAIESEDAVALKVRGETYLKLKRYDNALKDLNKSLEIK